MILIDIFYEAKVFIDKQFEFFDPILSALKTN